MSTDQKKLELKDRLPLTKVLGREDGGEGLVGQIVGVAGWVRTKREQGQVGSEFCFLEVSDGTMVEGLQVVVVSTVPDFHQLMKQVQTGASVFVVGELVKPPVQSKQKVELKATEVTLLGACDPDKYPLAKKHHTLEHLRSIGHLRARTKTIAAVARIRNALAMATHDYFQSLGFIYLHTPLITASDCEGAGEMFGVTTILKDRGAPMLPDGKVDWAQDFFKRPAFLTVSGQLDAEIYATAISKVYTFGPTFRAENSNTTRHLAEFWMIEPEIAFADLAEDMQVAEGYIKHVLRHVLEKCAADMAFFEESEIRLAKEKEKEEQKAAQQKGKQKGKEAPKPEVHKDWKTIPLRERIASVIAEPFARVTYTEVIDMLKNSGVQFTIPCPEWGEDLNSEHERYIAERVYKKPVIITNYPKKLKAFYMRANDDGKTVAAMDIVVPGIGEIIGGSQREERVDVLTDRIKELGLDEASYSWYLDLRRFGTVPHSGFGLGFERLVCYATGLENIRDAIPFPRFPGHADF